MSELTSLREAVEALAGRSSSPAFAELERRVVRRRRRRVAVAGAGVVALVVAVGTIGTGDLLGSDELVPASPTARPSVVPPASMEEFGALLAPLIEQVPGWARGRPWPEGTEYAFNGPCAGRWTGGATSGGDGGAATVPVGLGSAGFVTASHASDAAATLVERLSSCTTTKWRTEPIAGTGAVLATSTGTVLWIHRTGDTVDLLQVAPADGAPPADVQVAVTEWLTAYRTWQEQD